MPQLMTFQYSQTSAQWINGAWRTSTTFNGLPTNVGQSTTNGVDPVLKIEPYNNSLTPGTWSVTPTASWAVTGTAIGINSIASFTGNFLDCKVNGVSKFTVNYLGNVTATGTFNLTGGAVISGTAVVTGTVTTASGAFNLGSPAQATYGLSSYSNYISGVLTKSSNGLYSNTQNNLASLGTFAPLQVDYLQTCSQYLTPDSVAPSSAAITVTAGTSAANATLTTSAAHGLLPGQIVYVTGMLPIGYNGVYALQTASGSTLTYTTATATLGAATVLGKIIPMSATPIAITAVTYSGTMATVTVAAHPFKTGSVVAIQGITPVQFNGVFNVIVPDGSTTTFSYVMQAAGTAPTVGTSFASGMVLPTPLVNSAINGSAPITLTAITNVTTTVTATVAAHPFSVGEWVTIIGVTGQTAGNPNGTFQIASVISATQFTYAVPLAITGTLTGGTVQMAGYNNPLVAYGAGNITATGMRAMVSNNTATAAGNFAAAPSGVGNVAGNTVPVYWNGSAWAIG